LRRRVVFRIGRVGCAIGLAVAIAGCTNSVQLLPDNNEGGWFSKPADIFAKPSWARVTGDDNNVRLNPRGAVAPEELVSADGRCGAPAVAEAPAVPAAAPPPPTPPADRPVGTMAGDLASAPMPATARAAANPKAVPQDQQGGGPAAIGGVALGMTECDVVRRAGLPGNINISAGDKGERKVVLTYLTGTWPAIYTFDAGRLKIVDRVPVPETPAKPAKKQKLKAKKTAKPKTATRETEHEYIQ
jgi:hypothetical protein